MIWAMGGRSYEIAPAACPPESAAGTCGRDMGRCVGEVWGDLGREGPNRRLAPQQNLVEQFQVCVCAERLAVRARLQLEIW